jgi:hypothetical protein
VPDLLRNAHKAGGVGRLRSHLRGRALQLRREARDLIEAPDQIAGNAFQL